MSLNMLWFSNIGTPLAATPAATRVSGVAPVPVLWPPREDRDVSTFDIPYSASRTRVVVRPGALHELGPEMAGLARPTKVLLVSDETVAGLFADAALASLRGAGLETDVLVLPPGDGTKSLASADRIYDRLGEMRLARDGALVALGGGMVSDLTGFAAATWMRGVAFAICPTTVEADVDAAIGGKTAVNHRAGKNLIGAFHQPVLVQIDPECLRTLPPRDLVAGLAESIKHAVITDEPFLSWHEKRRERVLAQDPDVLTELVERNVRLKADVVSRDEQERTALRASLNFGHTVGHAIEAARSYALRHGECVALGMVAECRIAVAMGLLSATDADRVVRCIEAYGLPVRLDTPLSENELLGFMLRDKKVAGGKVRFTLPDGLGATVLRDDVPDAVVLAACKGVAL